MALSYQGDIIILDTFGKGSFRKVSMMVDSKRVLHILEIADVHVDNQEENITAVK